MDSKEESFVRIALDLSPHGIAVISIKDPDKGADVIVAWYDQNRNLVFSKELPEISPATLGNKTVEATPLDFTLRFGPDRADATAKLFLAQLEKNAGNTSNEGVIRAIEGVDHVFGVDIKPLLQKGWQEGSPEGGLRQLWHSFNKDHPEDAKAVAKLLVKHLTGLDVSPELAVNALPDLISSPGSRAMAAGVMNSLNEQQPNNISDSPIILPTTFLEKALLSLWADLQKASPSTAKTLAETLGVPPEKIASEISRFVDERAPSPTAWATQNSTHICDLQKGVLPTGNQPSYNVTTESAPEAGELPTPEAGELPAPKAEPLMGGLPDTKNIRTMIKEAVDASPTKVAIIAVKGGSEFGRVDHVNPEAYDHVLVAYYDEIQKDYVIAEMTPDMRDRQGYFGGRNDPGTLEKISTEWDRYVAVSLNLTPEQTLLLQSALLEHMGDRYSFIAQQGNSCAVLVIKALMEAGVWDWKASAPGMVEKVLLALGNAGFNVTHPGTLIAWAVGKGGQVFDSQTFVAPDLRAAFEMSDPMALLAFSSDAIATSSHEDRTSRRAVTDDEEGASPSEQVATASDDEDARGDDAAQQAEADDDHARPDDAAQQPETDDDEEASEEVLLASDNEDTRSDDDAQQLETDDDEEASQEEVVLASDNEDTRSDDDASQQPATDDDEDASQERAALVSDNEDAATDDTGVMETAKAEEASVNSTGDDEAAAAPGQPATPASADMEVGFSFAAFAKQKVTVEAAKEAMPVEQPSPEASSSPGTPVSEGAHPDVGSEHENVGNAAPTREPVVHHGDLAP